MAFIALQHLVTMFTCCWGWMVWWKVSKRQVQRTQSEPVMTVESDWENMNTKIDINKIKTETKRGKKTPKDAKTA